MCPRKMRVSHGPTAEVSQEALSLPLTKGYELYTPGSVLSSCSSWTLGHFSFISLFPFTHPPSPSHSEPSQDETFELSYSESPTWKVVSHSLFPSMGPVSQPSWAVSCTFISAPAPFLPPFSLFSVSPKLTHSHKGNSFLFFIKISIYLFIAGVAWPREMERISGTHPIEWGPEARSISHA